MLYYVATGLTCSVLGFYVGQYIVIKRVEKAAVKIRAATEIWSQLVEAYRSKIETLSVPEKASSHMKNAEKISAEIQSLCAQAEMPSMSSLHSKFKNDVKKQIVELNYRRIEQLRLAVESGYDPLISHEGIKKRLSEIVAEQTLESDKKFSSYKPKLLPASPDTKPTKTKPHLTIVR